MNTIYNFEASAPPALNTEVLEARAQKRRTRRALAAAIIASALSVLCLAVFALLLFPLFPVVAAASIMYIGVSAAGCGVIVVVSLRERVIKSE